MNISMKALTPNQVEEVHERTLSLLADQGIGMRCRQARDTFARHGARVEGERVYLSRSMVEEAVKAAPSSFRLHARNREKSLDIGIGCDIAISPVSGVPVILDESGQQRMVVFDDYQDMLRLSQTSPVINVANSGSLYPTCRDATHALYLQMYYTLKMTDLPLVGQTEGERVSEDCVELYQRATGMRDKTVVIGICNSLSPMAWDKTMLDGIRVMASKGQALNVSCCSMAGATAPVYLLGGVVEANAEVLAGLVYAQLINPGTPVIYGTTSSIMDMKSMGLSLGTPEYSLISTACAQMAEYYKVPYRSGGGLTDAKTIDMQAGMESAINLLVSMSNGIHFMLQGVGVLEFYMSMSFRKWVMDEEIILHIKRMQRGLGDFPDNLDGIIADGVAQGNFLQHKSTLKGFRKELYAPVIRDRNSFEAWQAKGRSCEEMASRCVQKRLESYVCPELGADALKDVTGLVRERIGYDPGTV